MSGCVFVLSALVGLILIGVFSVGLLLVWRDDHRTVAKTPATVAQEQHMAALEPLNHRARMLASQARLALERRVSEMPTPPDPDALHWPDDVTAPVVPKTDQPKGETA